jgi:hypothetical protein
MTTTQQSKTQDKADKAKARRWENRHTSVRHFGTMFETGHLDDTRTAIVSRFADLGDFLTDALKDGPELSTALRKLVEAKDCAVRQSIEDNPPAAGRTDERGADESEAEHVERLRGIVADYDASINVDRNGAGVGTDKAPKPDQH